MEITVRKLYDVGILFEAIKRHEGAKYCVRHYVPAKSNLYVELKKFQDMAHTAFNRMMDPASFQRRRIANVQ